MNNAFYLQFHVQLQRLDTRIVHLVHLVEVKVLAVVREEKAELRSYPITRCPILRIHKVLRRTQGPLSGSPKRESLP